MNLAAALDDRVAEWLVREIPAPTPRVARLHALAGRADAVFGSRRCGKTWLLFQAIHELERAGTPRARILYLNFEDERLVGLGAESLHLAEEALWRRHPASRTEQSWYFLDEVQLVPGWERFVRRLTEERRVQVAVTGSSAKLLSKEIATSLRGRSMPTELLPFSFAEALAHQSISPADGAAPASAERAVLEHALVRYLEVGGFPEVQRVDAETREHMLRDLTDVALFRDVVERHKVSNTAALRALVRQLIARPGGAISVHKVHRDLHSQGIAIGKDSLHEYLTYLEDACLVYTVPIATTSERVRQSNPRKVYLVDTGIARAHSSRTEPGYLLENAVYLELRRRGLASSYIRTRSGFEVDFLTENGDGDRTIVQVCTSLTDPTTRARELRAIEEAVVEYPLAAVTIITLHEAGEERIAGRPVTIVPAWKWMLAVRSSHPR